MLAKKIPNTIRTALDSLVRTIYHEDDNHFHSNGDGGRAQYMELISLLRLKAGDCGRVQRITAGANATRRLYEMGFNTGARVKVLKNDMGPLIVALEGNKIALGRGLAEKMLVNRLDSV